jgi:hypothetical protein
VVVFRQGGETSTPSAYARTMTSHPPLHSTIARLRSVLTAAYVSETEWPLQVRASLAALLELFAAEPELARLCTVEPFLAGPAIAKRYEEAIHALVPYLREGRALREGPEPFPETTERGLLGSIGTQIGRKVSAGEAEDLVGLLPDLVQFTLTPYLGAAQARRVALLDD